MTSRIVLVLWCEGADDVDTARLVPWALGSGVDPIRTSEGSSSVTVGKALFFAGVVGSVADWITRGFLVVTVGDLRVATELPEKVRLCRCLCAWEAVRRIDDASDRKLDLC